MGRSTHPTTDRWELFIPHFFPRSLNRTQDRHWVHRHRSKKRIMNTIFAEAMNNGGVPKFEGFVKLSITRLWGKGQRALDRVNLEGAVKVLEDAMRQRRRSGKGWAGGLGIFEDDDPGRCELAVEQRRNDRGDTESTLIVVEGRRVK